MANKTGLSLTDKPATRQRLDPVERRAQLLEHAISAFADAGIERAVHADVASRANVSTPTVFKYFSTRDALVDAVLSEVEQTLDSLENHFEAGKKLTSSQLVRSLSVVLSDICALRPDLMKVTLIWSVAFSPVRARYLSFEIRLQNILMSLLDSESSSKSDTYILFATTKLFIRMHFDDTTVDARRDYINRMCEILEAAEISVNKDGYA